MKTEWKGRRALHLGSDRVEVTVLAWGGHIVSFSFTPNSGHATKNVIWESPWTTADPLTPAHDELSKQYGGRPTGSFLASYSGHLLCLDCFGPPSEEEASLGVTLHGEAGTAQWVCERDDPFDASLTVRAELPISGLQALRKIQITPGESVVRVQEQVRNLRDTPREIQWQQHATLGVPLVNAESCSIAASVRKGRTWPLGYDGPCLLPSDQPFEWPNVYTEAHGRRDLRYPFTPPNGGFVVALQHNPEREIGFVSALNWEFGLVFGYCYRTADFPWLMMWHENRARDYAPWNGRASALGLEFGTTPLAVGKEEMARQRANFDGPIDRTVPPHGKLNQSWLMFLADVPKTWREIQDIAVGDDKITLRETGGGETAIVARGALAFLRSDNGPNLFGGG
ncbi:MAG TPA: hypothetical protein VFN62_12970 [Acidobacteriaceae bacterium]|nr:hypothetical protein [Acidobacteriaceae bacterium]